MRVINLIFLQLAKLHAHPRWSKFVFPITRFLACVVVCLALGVVISLMLSSSGEAVSDEKTDTERPYGLDLRIPWTTSRVVGTPADSTTSDISTAQVDLSSIERRPETFVEAGKVIFNGKGTCYSCHTLNPSAPKSRGPDLTNIGASTAERKPGMRVKAYLIESLYHPDAFRVPGYGKIMTPAWQPPISLSNMEIEAVIAFLQSQGGEVDLTPFEPPIDIQTVAKELAARPPVLTGEVTRGKGVFVNAAKCIACHKIGEDEKKPDDLPLDAGIEIVLGPDLTEIAALNSIRYIEESILNPDAEIVRGYGLATVQAGGAVIRGMLLSQDNEKIVLRIKEDTGNETERTILLSELDREPIETLVNLTEKGYFWMEITLAGTTTSISGTLVGEDDENITLKVGEAAQTVSKSNLKIQVVVITYDDEVFVGKLVAENEDEITLNIDGIERTFDKYEDLAAEPIYSRAFGKRIDVRSPMPNNFAQILSVAEFYDLLAFLSTLTGEVAGREPGPPLSLRARRTFTSVELDQPVYVEPEPGTDQLLVIQVGGQILRLKDHPSANTAELLLDMGRETYGLTFHPNYIENGYLYVVSNGPKGGEVTETKNRVSRFVVERQPLYRCDPNSELILLEWFSNNHNGGDLAFGPDGYLYITAGDGSMDSDTNMTGQPGSYDREPQGQNLSNVLATIMRIDVDHPEVARAYSIPDDNPFIHFEGARPEIWVYGIRNPWRITFDRETGHLWAGNVGQDQWEMIHLVHRGDNYGWSLYEGSHPFYPNRTPGPTPIVKPMVEHSHAEARSITGGLVYYGSKFPELRGAYIYGDYVTGKIWGLSHDGDKIIWQKELGDTTLQIVGFGVDHNGEILIVDHGSGLFQLEHKSQNKLAAKFPTRLSETGLFASVTDHQTAPSLVPYSVNAPSWSDGAHTERFIALPGDSQIGFTNNRAWNFPEGTVLLQTFTIKLEDGNAASGHRVETRLLTRQQGEWTGYSYAWNDEQTDATLVNAAGTDSIFTIRDSHAPGGSRNQTWHYPSRTDCLVCHTRAAGFVLGLNTLQMNKVHDYGGVSDNQLRTLDHIAAFTESLSKRPEDYPRLVNPYNPQEPLDARARSYLHANCANCHIHTGGGNARMELEFTTEREKTSIFGVPPQHEAFGVDDPMLIAPGSPEHSLIYYRVARRGKGHMPPLATSRVDRRAAQLLRDWIAQMKPTTEVGKQE